MPVPKITFIGKFTCADRRLLRINTVLIRIAQSSFQLVHQQTRLFINDFLPGAYMQTGNTAAEQMYHCPHDQPQYCHRYH